MQLYLGKRFLITIKLCIKGLNITKPGFRFYNDSLILCTRSQETWKNDQVCCCGKSLFSGVIQNA